MCHPLIYVWPIGVSHCGNGTCFSKYNLRKAHHVFSRYLGQWSIRHIIYHFKRDSVMIYICQTNIIVDFCYRTSLKNTKKFSIGWSWGQGIEWSLSAHAVYCIVIMLFFVSCDIRSRDKLWCSCDVIMEKSIPLISAWISNYIYHNMWAEISYPFPNFNGTTVEVWEWIRNFSPYFTGHVITDPCWDWS